jgi:hypothetical protein
VSFEPRWERHAYEAITHEALAAHATDAEQADLERRRARRSLRTFFSVGGNASRYADVARAALTRVEDAIVIEGRVPRDSTRPVVDPRGVEADYPSMGRVADVLGAVERAGLVCAGHFAAQQEIELTERGDQREVEAILHGLLVPEERQLWRCATQAGRESRASRAWSISARVWPRVTLTRRRSSPCFTPG